MRVLIADDHAVVRRGLQQIIAMRPGWTVGAEVSEADEILPLLQRGAFDALILDVTLQGRSGIDVLGQIRAAFPALPVLILSMHAEEQYALRCLRAGASGYIQKDRSPEELLHAIERVGGGHIYMSDAVAEQRAADIVRGGAQPPHERLSKREFEVFGLIAAGKGVTEIAADLHVSVKTVSTYRARILLKTGFRSNADIIVYAIHAGLL
jgi:two-component system invasion response regulator UvrY